MLLQIHHEFKDHTDLVEQRKFDSFKQINKEIQPWISDVIKRNPDLPSGAKWMICDEKSEFFKWIKSKEGHGN